MTSEDRLKAIRGEVIQQAQEVSKPKKKRFWNKKPKKNQRHEHSFNGLSDDQAKELSIDSDIPIVKDGTVREKNSKEKLRKRDKRRLKNSPEKAFFIEMYFSNGTSREFVITTKQEVFCYKKRWYYLRFEDSWFNLTQNQYKLNFFDDYTNPIDRTVVRKGDKNFFSVTPENLKPLIDMEYVKALASSQELDKYLKMVAIFGFINLLMSFFVIWKSSQAVKYIKLLAGTP